MNPKNTVVLFSHGFGIRKDNLGLFTYLSEKFEDSGYTTVLFDYYEFDPETQQVFATPFSAQAEKLRVQMRTICEKYPQKELVIIGQSQGCFIPALCNVTGVRQVVGISPYFVTDRDEIVAKYAAKNNDTNFDGITYRKRTEGTTTVIPKKYWDERFVADVGAKFNDLALRTNLTLICGTADPVAMAADIKNIKYTWHIITDADHDFAGENRETLYKILVRELENR